MTSPSIVWFRRDLRLTDNPALTEAVGRGGPVIPVFIHAPEEEAPWQPGGASRWWLHGSLESLAESLQAKGSRLVLRQGASLEVLRDLVRETGATHVFWNRLYDPATIERDKQVKAGLKEDGTEARSFKAALLMEPWEVEKASGGPFQVYTPYWKTIAPRIPDEEPLPSPARIPGPEEWPRPLALEELQLLPRTDWAGGLREMWTPGEKAAAELLEHFLAEVASRYSNDRNRPDRYGTSRLSPHLHWGEISPRQVWYAARQHEEQTGSDRGSYKFRSEVAWREFAHHLLFHFPQLTDEPLRENFKRFPWEGDEDALSAWQRGRTGYPVVDAGMRELWHTGWMHNRVRMVVASFLVKHLLTDWREGARWFHDTLVDADLANNIFGWQWAAGCGADAAPYFRIFNPILQGEKFDPKGEYVRRWVPEIAKLPNKYLNKPWEMKPAELEAAGVKLGETYPKPVVDHKEARQRALAAFQSIKESK